MREIAEETGLEIEDVQFLTAVNTVFSTGGQHYVTLFMTALAKAGADGAIPEPELRSQHARRMTYVRFFLLYGQP
ncbi:hypothetical protein LTR37_009632 [Vermiconidia calcicola]|uniref:Uncharacterized protein n=1 Tax=Vermiconidia calcicola TaxID=1690605 RepID=A0ACC3N7L2_9PEZI|nr:hypothetical protein LTR37_009632 [Vermiconidia calcicola]